MGLLRLYVDASTLHPFVIKQEEPQCGWTTASASRFHVFSYSSTDGCMKSKSWVWLAELQKQLNSTFTSSSHNETNFI